LFSENPALEEFARTIQYAASEQNTLQQFLPYQHFKRDCLEHHLI